MKNLVPIEIDGEVREIEIRAMDEDFIVYRKMYAPPLTPETISKVNPGDWREHLEEFREKGYQRVIEEFLRRQIRALGSCAVLAWDDGGVVGKMYFTTREMWEEFRRRGAWMCVEHPSMPQAIEALPAAAIDALLASPSRTLFVQCFNIGHSDARYQGKGLAGAMLDHLIAWARTRAWVAIEVNSCPDVVAGISMGGHMPRRAFLERHGFRVARELPAPAAEAAGRREAIERILDGRLWDADHGYMQSGRRNIEKVRALASECDWKRDCGVNYVMACPLE